MRLNNRDDLALFVIQLFSVIYLVAPKNGVIMMTPDPFLFYDFPAGSGIYWQTYMWMIGVHLQFIAFAWWKAREDRRASMLAFLVLMGLNFIDFLLSYNTTQFIFLGIPVSINTLAVAVLGVAIIYDRWNRN